MIDLLYEELSYEVYDKDKLYDLVCNNYKTSTSVVFNNMIDYYTKIINSLVDEFCKIVKVSAFNKYINSSNINNIYRNFKTDVNSNMSIKDKIKVLVSSNSTSLINQLHSTCVLNNRDKVIKIINKYNDSIKEELIKNVSSKSEFVLESYRGFIDSLVLDDENDKEKINEMNLKVITNVTYTYLKEQEYFVIDKYIDDNFKYINNFFKEIDSKLSKSKIVKKNDKNDFNGTKDYLLGFNNTIRVKAKKIFDEMNLAVTLHSNKANEKMKEFTDLISHIYEINIKFDKQFLNYKNSFNVSSREKEKFDKFMDNEFAKMTEKIKTNISNIFRENTKIYNNIIYKSFLLKSRVNDFEDVLSESKVKDLLVK